MIYTIPYIILVCIMMCASFLHAKTDDETSKRNITIFVVAVFFIFMGFRGFILSDWIVYYPYFYDCNLGYITSFFQGDITCYEPGYTLLNIICKFIFADYHFFVFVCSAIETILLYKFFNERVDNIPLAFTLFFVFDGLSIMANLMRNFIAILIFLNALKYIEQRKPVKYFAACILALSFHTTSILYFPLYFFFHKSINKWVFIAIFAVCNIIYLGKISVFLTIASLFGLNSIFEDRIRVYTELYNASAGLSFGYLERLFTGLMIFLYYDRLKEIRPNNQVFINGLIFFFIMFFSFSEFQTLSRRFSYLFIYAYWIIWIDFIKCFSIENNKKLFISFIFVYCILRTGISTYLPDFDYENILFGKTKSYQERLYLHNRTYDGP